MAGYEISLSDYFKLGIMKSLLLFALIGIFSLAKATDYPFTVNGKNYKIITTQKTWEDAAAWAVQDGGYLVHINSQQEQDSIYAAIQASGISTSYTVVNDGGGIAYIWIGATDKATEGTWLWDGDNDASGDNFYTGQGLNGSGNGAAVSNAFINWGGKSSSGGSSTNEPDDYFSNQDAGAIALDGWPGGSGALGLAGEWNDIAITNSLYFIVEYESAGIDEMQVDFQLDLYVHNQELRIQSNQRIQQLELYSVSGKLIQRVDVNAKQYRLTGLHRGIYLLRFRSTSGIIRVRKVAVI